MANQVTLTFAGETKSVEESFARAGGAAKKMGSDVEESAGGFRKAGEAADAVDTKAMGFRDTITGVQDSATGLQKILSGNGSLADGLFQLGAGVGDLASGFYNFLIPALEKSRLGTLAKAGADRVAAAGSRAWAGAQWLLNTAILASPITWIVVGVVALAAVIYLIATRTTWFQTIWRVAWSSITSTASAAWGYIRQIPGWISSAFHGLVGVISAPFRLEFNAIAWAWNNTVGRLSWTVPDWVPGIGGMGVSVPHLPTFHAGGVVPGPPGSDVLAMVQAGERISSVASGSGGMVIQLRIGDETLGEVLLDPLRNAVRTRGGNVQAVLSGR